MSLQLTKLRKVKAMMLLGFGGVLLGSISVRTVLAEEVNASVEVTNSLSLINPKAVQSTETSTYLLTGGTLLNTLNSTILASENETNAEPTETVSTETTTEVIPFETEVIQNPSFPAGEIKVIQEGVAGEVSVTKTTTVTTKNGNSQTSTTESRVPVKKPLNKIIEVGTKVINTTPSTSDSIVVSPKASSSTVVIKSKDTSGSKIESSEKEVPKDKSEEKKELPSTGSQVESPLTSLLAFSSIVTAIFLLRLRKKN